MDFGASFHDFACSRRWFVLFPPDVDILDVYRQINDFVVVDMFLVGRAHNGRIFAQLFLNCAIFRKSILDYFKGSYVAIDNFDWSKYDIS